MQTRIAVGALLALGLAGCSRAVAADRSAPTSPVTQTTMSVPATPTTPTSSARPHRTRAPRHTAVPTPTPQVDITAARVSPKPSNPGANYVKPTPTPAPTTAAPTPTPVTKPAPRVWGWGCADALAYLRAHANPQFTFQCPGDAWGGQAATCPNLPGYCPGRYVIVIHEPCPIAYKNEAANSWTWRQWLNYPNDQRRAHGLDPYGPSC